MLKVKVISLPYIFQVLYVLCFTRPRYQVSVNRSIGPLVLALPRKRLHLMTNAKISLSLLVLGYEIIQLPKSSLLALKAK